MLFLLTARRREWPLWVMVLAWLPALLVLGGRMYVRPETLTLLYLSIFLAVITRWDRFPRLALLLPLVQVAWVNSHGLFVLGPIVLSFGLIDAALRGGILAPERRKWWRTILAASLATGAALFDQSLWDHRRALSAGAGRDDEQPDLLEAYRGADADSGLHPERGSVEPAVATAFRDDAPGCSQLPGAPVLVGRGPARGVRSRCTQVTDGDGGSAPGRSANGRQGQDSGRGRGRSARQGGQSLFSARPRRSTPARAGGSAHSGFFSMRRFAS